MIRATDIHSLTDFTRHAKSYIEKIKKTKAPMAITINGSAEVVVVDAKSYQELVDNSDHQRFIASMRESEQAVREGQVQDLDEAFDDIRHELGL